MRHLPRTVITAAAATYAAVLAVRFLSRELPPVVPAIAIESIVAASILLSATILGDVLVRAVGFPVRTGAERVFFAGALGLGAMGSGIALLGFAGVLRAPVFAVGIAAPLLVGRRQLRDLVRVGVNGVRAVCAHAGSVTGVPVVAATVAALLATFLAAGAPPTQYDALVYHLALPAAYLREGRIFPVPYNLYTHFPQLAEMLFMAGMALCDDVVPALLSFGVLVLLGTGVAAFAREHLDRRVPALAVLLLCTAPATVLLGSSSYVELFLALFTFAALYATVRAVREPEDGRAFRSAVVAGFCAGCALAVKYTGGATVLVVCGMIAGAGLLARRAARGVRGAVVAAVCAAAVFAPWAVKNIVAVGNPVFPFLYDVIGYRNVPWTAESARGYFAVLTEYRHQGNVLRELLRLPFALIDDPTRFGGGADVLGDGGWPMLCALAPLLVFARGIAPGMLLTLVFGGVHFLVWFATKPVLRFLYPVYPVGALVAAAGCVAAGDRIGPAGRALLRTVCAAFIVAHAVMVLGVFDRMGTLGPVAGWISRDDYRATRISNSLYPAWRWIERSTEPRASVLLVGDQRAHGCPRRCVAPSVFAPNPLVAWANAAADAAALARRLRAEGFSVVVVNDGEGRRLHEGYGIFDFSEHGAAVWREFRASATVVFAERGVTVYQW